MRFLRFLKLSAQKKKNMGDLLVEVSMSSLRPISTCSHINIVNFKKYVNNNKKLFFAAEYRPYHLLKQCFEKIRENFSDPSDFAMVGTAELNLLL